MFAEVDVKGFRTATRGAGEDHHDGRCEGPGQMNAGFRLAVPSGQRSGCPPWTMAVGGLRFHIAMLFVMVAEPEPASAHG